MRIGRTIPPAAAPIYCKDLFSGLKGWLRGEEELKRFEDEIKETFDVRHCFLVSSGKTALALTLKALKELHPERDEVIIPAYTCYSVPSAVVKAGLKVSLCDIHPDTLDFDYEQLSNKLDNKRLLCVVPNHLFGLPADIIRLRDLVNDAEVTIVEDAAQAFGGQCSQGKLGTIGDVGIFSMGRGKAFSTVEGGIVISNRIDISEKIEHLFWALPPCRQFECLRIFLYAIALAWLVRPEFFWLPKSLPFLKLGETIYDPTFKSKRMSSLQAGMSKGWKERLAEFQRIRNVGASEWGALLSTNKQQHYYREQSSMVRFPWKINSFSLRDKALKKSDDNGLGLSVTYPDSINGIPELNEELSAEVFPVAKEHARTLVSLPIHPLMNEQDKANIKRLVVEVTEAM